MITPKSLSGNSSPSTPALSEDQVAWLSNAAIEGGGWEDNIQYFCTAKGRGTDEPTWKDMGNGLYNYKFDAGDELFVPFHVTHDYIIGSKAYPHVHFLVDEALPAGKTIVWSFTYTIAKGHHQGQSLTGATTAINLTYTSDGTEIAGEHLVVECSDLDSVDLLEPDSILTAGVKLVSEDVTGNIYGIQCDLHYLSSSAATTSKEPPFVS